MKNSVWLKKALTILLVLIVIIVGNLTYAEELFEDPVVFDDQIEIEEQYVTEEPEASESPDIKEDSNISEGLVASEEPAIEEYSVIEEELADFVEEAADKYQYEEILIEDGNSSSDGISDSMFYDTLIVNTQKGNDIIDTLIEENIINDASTEEKNYDEGRNPHGPCGKNAEWELINGSQLVLTGTGEVDLNLWSYDYEKLAVKTLIVNNGITSFRSATFEGFTNLTSVSLPDSLIEISAECFQECKNLQKIIIPSEVMSIGSEAFMGCSNLSEVFIPNSVKTIGSDAFSSCLNLIAVNIQNGLESIGDGAFFNCYNLQSIVLPQSLHSIGHSAFSKCSSLKTIEIPDGVTRFAEHIYQGQGTFEECTSLESVILSKNLEVIGNYTFSGCISLRGIELPEKLYSIGNGAFFGCTNLEDLVLPNNLKEIGDTAFFKCTKLKDVTLPEGLERIGGHAFTFGENWNGITVPKSVVYVDPYALGRDEYNFPVPGFTVYGYKDSAIEEVVRQSYYMYCHYYTIDQPKSLSTENYMLEEDGTLTIYHCTGDPYLLSEVLSEEMPSYLLSEDDPLLTLMINDYKMNFINENVTTIKIETDDIQRSLNLSDIILQFPNTRKIISASDVFSQNLSREWYCLAFGNENEIIQKNEEILIGWNSKFSNKIKGKYEVVDYNEESGNGEFRLEYSIDFQKSLVVESYNFRYPGVWISDERYLKDMIEELGGTFLLYQEDAGNCELDKLLSIVADDSVFYDGKSHQDYIEKEMHIRCEGDHGVESYLGHKILIPGKDFTVEYLNRGTGVVGDTTNAGSIKVTVTGINGHIGTLTGYYTIKPQALKDGNIVLSQTKFDYTGSEIRPKVTVKDKYGNVLEEGKDYTLTYKNNITIGTGSVIITGIRNYNSSVTKNFTIAAAPSLKKQPMTVKGKTVSIKLTKLKQKNQTITAKQAFDVKNAKGTITYKKLSGNKSITINKKTGKITVKKGLKLGTYKVKIQLMAAGTSKYKAGSKNATVTIKVK